MNKRYSEEERQMSACEESGLAFLVFNLKLAGQKKMF